jgi:hypothetical protein
MKQATTETFHAMIVVVLSLMTIVPYQKTMYTFTFESKVKKSRYKPRRRLGQRR